MYDKNKDLVINNHDQRFQNNFIMQPQQYRLINIIIRNA